MVSIVLAESSWTVCFFESLIAERGSFNEEEYIGCRGAKVFCVAVPGKKLRGFFCSSFFPPCALLAYLVMKLENLIPPLSRSFLPPLVSFEKVLKELEAFWVDSADAEMT